MATLFTKFRTILLNLVVMVLPAITLGQIDSLKQLLDQCHDSARYRIITELADELYYAGNLDESIQFYRLSADEELNRKIPTLVK